MSIKTTVNQQVLSARQCMNVRPNVSLPPLNNLLFKFCQLNKSHSHDG